MRSANGHYRESLLCCGQITGQELALGAVNLEREGKCAVSLPAVLRKQPSTGSEIG